MHCQSFILIIDQIDLQMAEVEASIKKTKMKYVALESVNALMDDGVDERARLLSDVDNEIHKMCDLRLIDKEIEVCLSSCTSDFMKTKLDIIHFGVLEDLHEGEGKEEILLIQKKVYTDCLDLSRHKEVTDQIEEEMADLRLKRKILTNAKDALMNRI